MSNKKDKIELEDARQVVITPADSKEVEKFFEYFDIPKTKALTDAFSAFQNDPTYVNQNELKFQLANFLAESDHPVFKDEVFANVIPESRESRDALAFERELEKQLTSSDGE